MTPEVTGFHDPRTGTISYLVTDPGDRRAAIVDPVLDYDARSGRTATGSADGLLAAAREAGVGIDWILETHAHADHMTAAQYVKESVGGTVAIGAGIALVQETWKQVYNLGDDFAVDGSQFDHLFADGEAFAVGALAAAAMAVPGHTPDSMAYRIGDAVFLGDTLFMPDSGSARCDFPGGDPRVLYRSIRRLLDLPPDTRLFACHDYGGEGREPAWQSTVAEQRARNIHVRDGIDEESFVAVRSARDKTLSAPALLLPALQVNLRAGHMPPPEADGHAYLKIPLNRI